MAGKHGNCLMLFVVGHPKLKIVFVVTDRKRLMKSPEALHHLFDCLHCGWRGINHEPFHTLLLHVRAAVQKTFDQFSVHKPHGCLFLPHLVPEPSILKERHIARGIDEICQIGLQFDE
jgi:hypothetical protein